MGTEKPRKDGIFNIAVEIQNPVKRAAYLDDACGNDASLREEVDELLRHDQEGASFLESPPHGVDTTIAQSIPEKPGTQIGPYKLLQQIGEGGFGVVYMAEQREPVIRKVALKIIKPGMDTRQVIARFEAERQALALMDHPNIARVLDAGSTVSGRPYFVMELVKGVPITEYCDKNKLSAEERLRLFMETCRAVQHAHQKGIIHRDIKPSNILVTLHDGHPAPKVIDFGVSKAISQRLTEKTLFTAYGQMIGTPQYMSPEQAEISGLDVDTRSDVYSLGVLLYELLTGTTPLESDRLRTAGYAEIQRIIHEEDPPKPSVRLSTLGERLTVVAKDRSTDPKRLRKVIRGELDWVVMKSLEKERGRRYDSPNGLAEDVQRFLSGQAVEAHPPSAAYRLRKFMRKYRMPVAAVLAVLLALVLGVVGTTSGLIREARLASRLQLEIKDKKAALNREQETSARLEEGSYRDRMNLAYQAWNERNRDQLERLLNGLLPAPGDSDPPGFELRYLWARYEEMCRGTVHEFHTPGDVTSVAYCGTGRYLAIACDNRKVLLYDFQDTEETPKALRLPDTIQGNSVILSKHGKYLAACLRSHQPGRMKLSSNREAWRLRVLDISAGKELTDPNWEKATAVQVVFSPDEKTLVASRPDGSVEIRRIPDGEVIWSVRPFESAEHMRIALSPDGRLLAAASSEADKAGDVILWDLDRRQRLPRTSLAQRFVNALAFEPSGETLWAGTAFGALHWQVGTDGLGEPTKLVFVAEGVNFRDCENVVYRIAAFGSYGMLRM